jgi:hypothetical protein
VAVPAPPRNPITSAASAGPGNFSKFSLGFSSAIE